MRSYTLKKIKEMVSLYNESKSADSVADELKLPRRDVASILVWLHRHDPANKEADKSRSFTLKLPTNHVWAQFLYMHDIAAHTAAACLNWPLERLLETCGGPKEWAKHSGRRPIRLHTNDIWGGRERQDRRPEDPDADQIAAAAAEVRKGWRASELAARDTNKKQKPVEAPSYTYDSRNGTFT